jgi:hypothetical protein
MGIDILDYKTLTLNNIVYEDPKKIKGGSYISEMKYVTELGEKKPIIIQTPRLISMQGISKMDTRCHIELDFDKDHWPFYEFITDLDDHNIVIVEKYSDTWFKQKFPMDVVEEFYKSPVKLGRGKNPPKLKLRIPITQGELGCEIYDSNKHPIDYTTIGEESKIISVLHLIGLRFLKQQVICEWVPLQLKVNTNQSTKKREYLIDETLLSDNEEQPDSQLSTIDEPHFTNADIELKSEEPISPPSYDSTSLEDTEEEVAKDTIIDINQESIVPVQESIVPVQELTVISIETTLLSKIELLENEIEKKNKLIENLRQLLIN